MDDSKTYVDYLIKIRRKSIEVEEVRDKYNHVLRRCNCSKTRINSDSNSNQAEDQKSNEDQPKRWLPRKNGIRRLVITDMSI